jgi:hypothetical protein
LLALLLFFHTVRNTLFLVIIFFLTLLFFFRDTVRNTLFPFPFGRKKRVRFFLDAKNAFVRKKRVRFFLSKVHVSTVVAGSKCFVSTTDGKHVEIYFGFFSSSVDHLVACVFLNIVILLQTLVCRTSCSRCSVKLLVLASCYGSLVSLNVFVIVRQVDCVDGC